jgi:hypothetical protein
MQAFEPLLDGVRIRRRGAGRPRQRPRRSMAGMPLLSAEFFYLVLSFFQACSCGISHHVIRTSAVERSNRAFAGGRAR